MSKEGAIIVLAIICVSLIAGTIAAMWKVKKG